MNNRIREMAEKYSDTEFPQVKHGVYWVDLKDAYLAGAKAGIEMAAEVAMDMRLSAGMESAVAKVRIAYEISQLLDPEPSDGGAG